MRTLFAALFFIFAIGCKSQDNTLALANSFRFYDSLSKKIDSSSGAIDLQIVGGSPVFGQYKMLLFEKGGQINKMTVSSGANAFVMYLLKDTVIKITERKDHYYYIDRKYFNKDLIEDSTQHTKSIFYESQRILANAKKQLLNNDNF